MLEEMSRDDLNMYYSGCYLAYRDEEDVICPIYILSADQAYNEEEDCDDGPVYFNCKVYKVDGSEQNMEVELNDANLVVEHPKCGYFLIGGDPVYVSRVPSRQYKKGFSPRQYENVGSGSAFRQYLFQAFNGTPLSRVDGNDFDPRGIILSDSFATAAMGFGGDKAYLKYKDTYAGIIDKVGTVTLAPSAALLSERVMELGYEVKLC